MSVIFAVLGAVIGMIFALSNAFPVSVGAVLGALAGFALAQLRKKKPQNAVRAACIPAPRPQSRRTSVQSRP